MNYYNKVKSMFKRSQTYPGCNPDNVADKNKSDDTMEVRVCTASYCATCEEMVFQSLKTCKECGERKICYFCYEDGKTLCVECHNELMKMYDRMERELLCSSKKLPIEKAKTIEDYVDQLL